MGSSNKMIVIQGPIISEEVLDEIQRPSCRLIYSVQMANGMVFTSPEGFERATSVESARTVPCEPEVLHGRMFTIPPVY
jgi:hypothetical protein